MTSRSQDNGAGPTAPFPARVCSVKLVATALGLWGTLACTPPISHAVVVRPATAPALRAVLALPTTCASLGSRSLCQPASYVAGDAELARRMPDTFAPFID